MIAKTMMAWIGDRNRLGMTKPACLCASLAIMASTAGAAPQILVAVNDPNQPNQFVVNFPPELGGPQTAAIPSTKYLLRIDDEKGTAGIVSWVQRVNPLMLAGINTGNITVRLASDSTGVFDGGLKGQEQDGVFSTTEAYNVHFAGDLSMFGLQSPFFIPSSSTGEVVFDAGSSEMGTISMEWTGLGSIPNPFDPANPFVFSYACQVNSRFQVAAACETVQSVESHCYNGRLRVFVNMVDDSQDGGVVAIDVNGEPFSVAIEGDQGNVLAKKRTGEQEITLMTGTDGCMETLVDICE